MLPQTTFNKLTLCHADPATNDVLGTIPEMGLEETQEAIAAAAKAFPEWSRTTAKVRC
jgi:NAD-dependent aldehyde dehydrogenases